MMRQQILTAFGLVGILSVAACHKAVPVASRPTAPAPVVAAAPAPAPRATPRTPPVSVTPSQTAQTTRPATMTPQERATLNERLARLEDAEAVPVDAAHKQRAHSGRGRSFSL